MFSAKNDLKCFADIWLLIQITHYCRLAYGQK